MFEGLRNSLRRRKAKKDLARLRSITVGEIMTKYIITLKANDDVVKAATKMIAEDISCLVITDGDMLLGVLSERDFLKKVPLSTKVFDMKVKDIMRDKPVTCSAAVSLEQAAKLMIDKNVRRLVIVKDEKPIGIVTQTDFTKAMNRNISCYPDDTTLMVSQMMSSNVLTVTSDKSVADAKQAMLKRNVGAIIIIDKKDNYPTGIFTEYDVVMQFYDQHGKLEMKGINNYMRKYVRAAPVTMSVLEANRLMLDKNIRRLLIVEKDKMAGIVTQTDICRKFYTTGIDNFSKALQDPKIKWKSLSTALHGEFKGEHLKVYDNE